MTFEGFLAELEKVQTLIESADSSAGIAAGDALKIKQNALQKLETLSLKLDQSGWSKEEISSAVHKLITARTLVSNQAGLEGIQGQLGQVLSDAAGVINATGGVYSKQGIKATLNEAPASRIDGTY